MNYKTIKQSTLIEKITKALNLSLTSKVTSTDVLAKLEDAFIDWGLSGESDFIWFIMKLALIDVRLVTDEEEFADIVTLTDYAMEHSWAGREEQVESAYILVDSNVTPLQPGMRSQVIESSNGNIVRDETSTRCPDFDTGEEYCILLSSYSLSDYNSRYEKEREFSLVVYNPN